MAKRTPRDRTVRRSLEREAEKAARDREKLSALEDGGSPERPIEVATAQLVEVKARAMRCPRCLGELQVDEHTAETHGAKRLRVARVICRACGARRQVYFSVVAPLAN